MCWHFRREGKLYLLKLFLDERERKIEREFLFPLTKYLSFPPTARIIIFFLRLRNIEEERFLSFFWWCREREKKNDDDKFSFSSFYSFRSHHTSVQKFPFEAPLIKINLLFRLRIVQQRRAAPTKKTHTGLFLGTLFLRGLVCIPFYWHILLFPHSRPSI